MAMALCQLFSEHGDSPSISDGILEAIVVS